jgi:O-antigen/teichoic acid export membrane protein
LELFSKILGSSLFKVGSLNSISVILKIGTGLITSKFLAIFVGPSGMALVGNFRNFISSVEGVSTLAFSSGIVKYVGENEDKQKELGKIISTVLLSFLVIAFIISTLIFIFSDYLCFKIFGNDLQYAIIFKVVAIVLPWNVVSVLFISIINGLGRYNKVIFANIISNILGVLLSLLLIYEFKTLGALLSIAIVPVILFFVTSYYLPSEIQIFKRVNFHEYDFNIVKKLAAFSLMILPSTLLSPFLNLQIRNFLISTVGINQSGLWEAISRISSLYLLFVSTIVSVYFYPKLIKSNGRSETKEVIWSFYKFILPVFIVGTILVYFSRFLIVKILFTNEFLPVSELFFWQLIGDVFKVASMILGFQFLAKKIILPFIFFDILSNVLLYFLSIFFIKSIGIQGVVIAQAFDNFIYLLILVIFFRKNLF